MTIESWLQAAVADAERRGLPELKPLLETLAQATRALRAADINEDPSGRRAPELPAFAPSRFGASAEARENPGGRRRKAGPTPSARSA